MTISSAMITTTTPHRISRMCRLALHSAKPSSTKADVMIGPLELLAKTIVPVAAKPTRANLRFSRQSIKAMGQQTAPTVPARIE